jgi:linoleoyl-CoA desaturase
MFSKSIFIILLLGFAYSNLVFFQHNFFITLLFIFMLAQNFVLVGFNIQHDANHGSYSQNKKLILFSGLPLILSAVAVGYGVQNTTYYTIPIPTYLNLIVI